MQQSCTSLHVAAKKGECLEIVKILKHKGADMNIKDDNGVRLYY